MIELPELEAYEDELSAGFAVYAATVNKQIQRLTAAQAAEVIRLVKVGQACEAKGEGELRDRAAYHRIASIECKDETEAQRHYQEAVRLHALINSGAADQPEQGHAKLREAVRVAKMHLGRADSDLVIGRDLSARAEIGVVMACFDNMEATLQASPVEPQTRLQAEAEMMALYASTSPVEPVDKAGWLTREEVEMLRVRMDWAHMPGKLGTFRGMDALCRMALHALKVTQ